MDIRACLDEPFTLGPEDTALIPSGFAVRIAEPNLAAVLLPRSGLGHKYGIVLGNLVGLIDYDDQAEIFLSCWNRGEAPFTMRSGECIAQLVFVPLVRAAFEIVELFQESAWGIGAFGHTPQVE